MKKLFYIVITSVILLTSCGNNQEKEGISNSLVNSMSLNEKLKYLITYSDKDNIEDATRQVARTIGCTKSSITRILEGETVPSTLMQNEVDNVLREALKKTKLKDLDKTTTFWTRNLLFWTSPDTTDLYVKTINPLYEEIP